LAHGEKKRRREKRGRREEEAVPLRDGVFKHTPTNMHELTEIRNQKSMLARGLRYSCS
jgi:hypothetical protein